MIPPPRFTDSHYSHCPFPSNVVHTFSQKRSNFGSSAFSREVFSTHLIFSMFCFVLFSTEESSFCLVVFPLALFLSSVLNELRWLEFSPSVIFVGCVPKQSNNSPGFPPFVHILFTFFHTRNAFVAFSNFVHCCNASSTQTLTLTRLRVHLFIVRGDLISLAFREVVSTEIPFY